jgi:hypothetical protein
LGEHGTMEEGLTTEVHPTAESYAASLTQ